MARHSAWFRLQHARGTSSPLPQPHTWILPRLWRDPLAEVTIARWAVAAQDLPTATNAATAAANRARGNPTSAPMRVAARHAWALVVRDPIAMREVVSALAHGRRPLVHAEALVDLANLVERSERAAVLDAALERFVFCGATADARAVRRQLLELGVARRPRRPSRPLTGWDALTVSERTVARLVASGLTNQAVAERLVVSPHTVSTHVSSSFRKLGISSRLQLARLVFENDAT
jgi:DNA-binding CsgD family transcriptional regulator